MRNYIKMISAFLMIVLTAVTAHAAAIGGAETIGKGKFSVGAGGEFIADRKMDTDEWVMKFDVIEDAGPGSVYNEHYQYFMEVFQQEIVKNNSVIGTVQYGVLDNLDIYVKVGSRDYETRARFQSTGRVTVPGMLNTLMSARNGLIEQKTQSGIVWGLGGRGTVDIVDGWFIGCDAQYTQSRNRYKSRMTSNVYMPDVNVNGDQFITTWSGTIILHEWQIAPYIAKRLWDFVPYIGMKYSGLVCQDQSKTPYIFTAEPESSTITDYTTDPYHQKSWNKNVIGMFVGMDYKIGDHFVINIEGVFFDETGMSVGAKWIF